MSYLTQCSTNGLIKMGATPVTIFLTLEITLGVVTGQLLTWELMKSWVTIEPQRSSTQTAKPGAASAWLTEHFLPKKSPMMSFSRGKHNKVQELSSPQMHFCTSSTLLYLETTQNTSNVKDWWLPDICSAFWDKKENYAKKYPETPNAASIPAAAVSSLLWQDRYGSKMNFTTHHLPPKYHIHPKRLNL